MPEIAYFYKKSLTMKFLLQICWLSTVILIHSAYAIAQTENKAIPQWVVEDWAVRTAGTGIWITDNSPFKSEQEPFDQYSIQWTYGIGNNHLEGKLFCLQNGERIVTAWSFTEFWDPEKEQVRVLQIGGDGTVGQGTLTREENGQIKEQQSYASPGGGSFETGHLMWFENGEHHTQSFQIVDGVWNKQRKYVWTLKKSG